MIIPNYNHARYLPEQLEAVLSQSVRPQEVIVVDDASTDDSVRLVEQIAKRDPIVRLLRNEKRVGVNVACNRGMAEASSEYLYFGAADDKVLPGFVEATLTTVAKYPQAGICCSSRSGFSDADPRPRMDRQKVGNERGFIAPQRVAFVEREAFSPIYPRMGIISTTVAVIKKSAMMAAGGYIPELEYWSDGFLFYVVGFRQGICPLPDHCFASYRGNPNTYSQVWRRDPRAVRTIASRTFDLLLSSPYSDVLKSFRDSGILRDFGIQGVRLMLENPRYRELVTPLVVRRAIWADLRELARPFVPDSIVHRIRDHSARRTELLLSRQRNDVARSL